MHHCTPRSAYRPVARQPVSGVVRTVIATLGFVASVIPAAADFPERNITLIVPFAAGGSTDAIARIVGDHMAKTLGRSVVIENDAGAGGTTPTKRVAQAAADGYTLIIGNLGTHGAAPSQYPNLKYDPATDFTPIGLTAGLPIVIVTRKNFPANNLMEFVDYVKKNQDKVNEAHGGAGGQMHTTCTLLQSIMGTKTARVAYRGAGPAINDMVGGQVDFACISLAAVASQIQAWHHQGHCNCESGALERGQGRANNQRGRSARVPSFGLERDLCSEESASRDPGQAQRCNRQGTR